MGGDADIIERAWGKPKDFDPTKERERPRFDPRRYTAEQLDMIQAAITLIRNPLVSTEVAAPLATDAAGRPVEGVIEPSMPRNDE